MPVQIIEDLRRPDDRNRGRLTEPENLLLDLRHAAEVGINRQVAARDHHRRRPFPRSLDEQTRKVADCLRHLDREDERRKRLASQALGKVPVEELDGLRPLDEGEADEVGMVHDEVEVAKIVDG